MMMDDHRFIYYKQSAQGGRMLSIAKRDYEVGPESRVPKFGCDHLSYYTPSFAQRLLMGQESHFGFLGVQCSWPGKIDFKQRD
jgi:hypothetical protein